MGCQGGGSWQNKDLGALSEWLPLYNANSFQEDSFLFYKQYLASYLWEAQPALQLSSSLVNNTRCSSQVSSSSSDIPLYAPCTPPLQTLFLT